MFGVILLTYLCSLADKTVIRYSCAIGKMGGWILVGLFFTSFAMETDHSYSFFAVSWSIDDLSVERLIEAKSMMILRIYQRIILLVFTVIWGWRYLNGLSSSSKC